MIQIVVKSIAANMRQKKSYSSFIEKSSTVVHKLLIGEGNAKSRLSENELLVSYILRLEVPDDLIPLQKEILKRLSKKAASKVGDKIHVTSYQNTVSSMQNSTASKIIDNIYTLYRRTKWANNGL